MFTVLIRLLVVVRRRPPCTAMIAASSCCTPEKKCHVCCSNKGLLPEKGTASRSISAPPQPPRPPRPPPRGTAAAPRAPATPKPDGTVPNPKGSEGQPSPNGLPRAFPSPSTPTGELFRKCQHPAGRGITGAGCGRLLGVVPAASPCPGCQILAKMGGKREKISEK